MARVVPVLGACALLLSACTVNRELLITEVGLKAVELHLAEPANNVLGLGDVFLEYKNSNGDTGRVELSGQMPGGGYLIVFEDANHMGNPVAASYSNFSGRSVPGLMVRNGFFGNMQLGQSLSFRVSGRHFRLVALFPVWDRVDDVVLFGPQPRPAIGGVFLEDGSLANDFPRPPASNQSPQDTVSRGFPNGTAQDANAERDWRTRPDSFGRATP
jgi:hypothetical protein